MPNIYTIPLLNSTLAGGKVPSLRKQFANGIILHNGTDGLTVEQYGEKYVARNWQLTEPVAELVGVCLASGLRWMIRNGHPRTNARLPNTRGVAYLAFSPTMENQWSLAVDTYSKTTGDYGHVVFNGKYREQFDLVKVPYGFEKRNKSAGHLVVKRALVLDTIQRLASFSHDVLYLGRRNDDLGLSFRTEYDIQRRIILNWDEMPFGRSRIVGDEFPLTNMRNSERIDILAVDPGTNTYFVIEVKRGEANLGAVDQLSRYVESMPQNPLISPGLCHGVLIAERIGKLVHKRCKELGFDVFEISSDGSVKAPA